ncbi:MAG: TIGR02996 domain-containing protein [Archangiaceae bacterium]|nr:TIGR02996 domain-containing protein [Archangiaceae bacterium]
MARAAKTPPPPTNLPLDSTGQKLLDAVLADADDLESRLVFADWLVERGDPRGEFIQLQCALGRPLHGAKGTSWNKPIFQGDPAELQAREAKLLKTYAKAWLEPMRAFVRTWKWDNGFVSGVVADATKFISGRQTIFATTPLVDVALTALKPAQLKATSLEPTTARLRRLDVGFQKLDANALEAFGTPQWSRLRSLRLAGNRFGPAGAAVLARAVFPALEALELNDAQLDDACVEALVEAPFFPQLTSLELGWNEGITARSVELVLRRGRSLKRLRVRSTGLTEKDLQGLGGSSTTLEHLHVSPQVEAAAVKAFGSRVSVTS